MFLYKKHQSINNYTIVFPHKEGSYAETYRVKDSQGNLRFLKLINTSKLHQSQFDNNGKIIEIEIAKHLNHPNLCKFVDSGSVMSNGQNFPYIVFEFVSGETLDKHLVREGRLSVYKIKQIVKALLSALHYLHTSEIPIIHNEVTIQNLMLDFSGSLDNLKLIDFGNAQFLNESLAKPNLFQLNPFCLAPERFNGICCVQSDLFSVGVVLYQLIFGSLPWHFDTSRLEMSQIVESLQTERRKGLKLPEIEIFELDEQLLDIIKKALQLNVQDRFQTAQEFIDALDGKYSISTIKKTEYIAEQERIEKKSGGFADVAGMEDLKEQLRSDVIDLLQNPEQARTLGLSIPNGILFYGPPGCGKTFFAEKFAEETGFNYQYVKGSDVASPYIDGGKGKIADIFSKARENAPTILFLDEVDSIIRDRNVHNNPTTAGAVNQFLMELNNCGKDNVLVIGATNKPLDVDEAALRAGRLELKYYIPQPDKETRREIFRINMLNRKHELGIDYDKLADLTENYISADIRLVIDTAARLAFRRKIGKITMSLLEESVANTSASLTIEQIRKHEEIRDEFAGLQTPIQTKAKALEEDNRSYYYNIRNINPCFMDSNITLAPYNATAYRRYRDAIRLPQITNTDKIKRFLPGVNLFDKIAAEQELKKYVYKLENQLGVAYIIRVSDIAMGVIWISTPLFNKKTINYAIWTISFFIADAMEHRGIMYKSIKRVLKEVKLVMGAKYIYALVDKGNKDCVNVIGRGLFQRAVNPGFRNVNNLEETPYVYVADLSSITDF